MNNAAIPRNTIIGRTAAIGAAAALLIGAALIPSVHAAPAEDVPSVALKYDAQKAATERGAMELYARLVYAAREVCPIATMGDRSGEALVRRCQKEALKRAVSQIHERHLVEIAAKRENRG
jgi:UrcA family protein